MLIPRVCSRNIFSASLPNRLENAMCNRPFLKKIENCISLISARNYRGYEGDGKTVATLINSKSSNTLAIHQYMPQGFVLPNGSQLVGSLIIFPHVLFSWHVSEAKNVTVESLVLFKLIEPKIDLLVFGYGNRNEFTPEVRENFTKCCKTLGLRYEALPTEHAVGTFNFLADERRLVAAALIPPKSVDRLRIKRTVTPLLEEGEEEEDEELRVIDDSKPDKRFLK